MAVVGPVQQQNMGAPQSRIDGRAKVTGAAPYASDFAVGRPAYAYFVTSAIARGRIEAFDLTSAQAVPGVLDIMTYETMKGTVRKPSFFAGGGYASTTIVPLDGPEVWHDGQIVAMVVAESYEEAREAAYKVRVTYREQPAAGTFGSPGTTTVDAADASKDHEDPAVGDIAAGFAAAAEIVDEEYATPTQHHNAIELYATTCLWTGDKLAIYEPSQVVHGLKHGVAEQLGMSPDKIRIVSPFVGGAFGSKASVTPRTALIALAARRLGRPVKLVLTREQGFSVATYRAETRHRLRLGADADGKFTALSHEGWEVTSRPDPYLVGGTDTTARLYACPNVFTKVRLVHADRNTPGFMRSPPEVPYLFALESAIDELAVKLGIDPIELRRRNDTMKEPIKGLPYTSRSLMECFDQAAESFGWSRRSPAAAMREGDWLIGWGCASTCYPTALAPATARVTFWKDGRVKVETAAHDLGTGAYTALAQVAAERLGVAVDLVTMVMGDSDLPPSPVAGGSITTASVSSVIAKGCDTIRAKLGLSEAGTVDPSTRSAGFERLGVSVIEEYAEFVPHGVKPEGVDKLYAGHSMIKGGSMMEDRIQYAFGAEFVEVRIHARTCEVRVPRVHGAFAAGHIVNPKTAHSQLMGGLIWGVSSALHEATELDLRAARYINDNLADYLVPVNADIEDVSVILVPERDTQVNPLGIKGLGELGNVGTNAAVANAVYHATGKRIRELPIRLEKLLA